MYYPNYYDASDSDQHQKYVFIWLKKCVLFTIILSETILTPINISFPEIKDTRLLVQWQMVNPSLRWKFNVTCSGMQSTTEDTDTERRTTQVTCYDLTPGDKYNVTVSAYFTNDIDEVFSGSRSVVQAVGKTNIIITAPDKAYFQPQSTDVVLFSPRKYMLWVLNRSAYIRQF